MTSRPTARTATVLVTVLVTALLLAGCSSKTSQPPQSAGQAAGAQASVAVELSESTSDFAIYLRQQATLLDTGTAEFAAAYQSGDDALARSLYAPTRMFYNRMLVAQTLFTDLAAQLDAHQADLAPGAAFTGWHAIESDLYPAPGQAPLTAEQRTDLATRLASDTHALYEKVMSERPTVDQQTEGAATLLQTLGAAAAARRQDAPSGSDVSDLQGYVDSAHLVFEGIRVVLVTQDAALATTLDHQFGALQNTLNDQRTGVTFRTDDQVSDADWATLVSQTADLAASMARVTSTMAPATASPSPAPAG
ncbi:EfeM/EfeO family lipoprotein [Subtercola sp. YIM 133946]|uniref:EfeM/EfeO family lipoprotein n=1 Tax=Subtercola sp. YIM 133946 TaxID=3118909 RepID=UPI002F91F3C7